MAKPVEMPTWGRPADSPPPVEMPTLVADGPPPVAMPVWPRLSEDD